jgi:hypothetical protein
MIDWLICLRLIELFGRSFLIYGKDPWRQRILHSLACLKEMYKFDSRRTCSRRIGASDLANLLVMGSTKILSALTPAWETFIHRDFVSFNFLSYDWKNILIDGLIVPTTQKVYSTHEHLTLSPIYNNIVHHRVLMVPIVYWILLSSFRSVHWI